MHGTVLEIPNGLKFSLCERCVLSCFPPLLILCCCPHSLFTSQQSAMGKPVPVAAMNTSLFPQEDAWLEHSALQWARWLASYLMTLLTAVTYCAKGLVSPLFIPPGTLCGLAPPCVLWTLEASFAVGSHVKPAFPKYTSPHGHGREATHSLEKL